MSPCCAPEEGQSRAADSDRQHGAQHCHQAPPARWLWRCWCSALPGLPTSSLPVSWGPSCSIWGHLRCALGTGEAGILSWLLPAPCPNGPLPVGEGAPAHCGASLAMPPASFGALLPPTVSLFVSTEHKYALGNREGKQQLRAGPPRIAAPRGPRSCVAVCELWWEVVPCARVSAWCWSCGLAWWSLSTLGLKRRAPGPDSWVSPQIVLLFQTACPGCRRLVPMLSGAERRGRRTLGC